MVQIAETILSNNPSPISELQAQLQGNLFQLIIQMLLGVI